MYKILVVDDEIKIRELVRKYAEFEGHIVKEASDGRDAISLISKEDFDIVILDIMMPVLDGFSACAEIRKFSSVPIIILSARSEEYDKISGFRLGIDDYVTKPFNPVEVVARVRAQVRRYTKLGSSPTPDGDKILSVGEIEMNCRTREVRAYGDPVSLTATEYDILHLLLSHPGQVFKSREIYRLIRDESPVGSENTIAVHIRHLREKIEINPAEPKYLKVLWGHGYKIDAKEMK